MNIDNLAALGPAVARMTHKDASLCVAAEHCPVVGSHLLAAISEVIGTDAFEE